jgi:long-chain acyl-CoA synthetase
MRVSSAAVPKTLQDVVAALPALARRRAVGLHTDLAARWWTYERLHHEIGVVAHDLHDRGIGRGDRVALWARNSPEWVAAFLGAAMRGAVAVLIDSDVPAEAVADVAHRERCRLIYCDEAPAGAAASSMSWVALTSSFGQWRDARLDRVMLAVGEDDPVALLYSSGTTAAPKGVLLSHRNIVCQIEPFRPWRRLLVWLPFRMLVLPPASHVLGLVVGLVIPLSIGLSIFYSASTRVTTWVRVIRDHRILVAVAVPRVLQVLERHVRSTPVGRAKRSLDTRLRDAGPAGRAWWPFWARGEVLGRPFFHLFVVGGAHLPAASVDFWRRTGVLVVQGYGLAETTAIVSLSNPFSRTLGDVGRPRGWREVTLAPDGEILVRGPHIALSSRDDRAATVASKGTGWLATGDLGRLDRRGRLTIVGRKKDVIVTAEGFNVHPDEVEAAIARQPGVLDGVVVATTTDDRQEVHAVLRVVPGADPAAIVRGTNAELAEHQRVRSWTTWPGNAEIPRNRMGKVLRSAVGARLLQFSQRVARPPVTDRVTLARLAGERDRRLRLQLLAEYLVQDEHPSDRADLRLSTDLGLSSLDIVELLALVEGSGSQRPLPTVGPDATVADLRAQVSLVGEPSGSRVDGTLPDGEVPARPPPWTLPLRLLQPVTRPLALGSWTMLHIGVDAHWEIDPRRLDRPFILAAAPHRHWLDGFVIARSLPGRLLRRLHVLVEHDFSEHFRPDPETPLQSRLWIAFAYYIGLPALFPFTVLKPYGRTREGLIDAARHLDRGRILLSFPMGLSYAGKPGPDRVAPGIARLAIEAGRPIVPVYIDSRECSFDWHWRRPRERVAVFFGAPITVPPDAAPADVTGAFEASLARLRGHSREVSTFRRRG